MPAFYRMPVVYVALAVGVALWLGLGRRAAREVVVQGQEAVAGVEVDVNGQAGVAVAEQAIEVESIEPPGVDPAAEAGILRNPEGLRRKVLVQELGLRCIDRAVGGEPVGPPLDYFSIHYVRGQTPPGPEPRLEVGPREGQALGWVPAGSVLEWDSRLMAVPTKTSERTSPLLVYHERACLLDRLSGRACARHADGRCPIEAEEPEGGEGLADTPLGLPVLQSARIPQPDGTTRTIHEVAVLVRDLLPLPPPTEPPVELRQALKQVYLAFVVDTTQSMEVPIEAVKQFAARLATETVSRAPGLTIHLALVEYRDRSEAFGFETRRVTDFTDPASFRGHVARLASARRGDGTTAEAVLTGVKAALASEEDGGLSWPQGVAGEAATKLLILLGDAPDHERDLTPFQAMAERARNLKLTIAAVGLEPTPERRVLSRSERARYEAQWQALAEGSYRPLDKQGRDLPALKPVLAIGAGEGAAAQQLAAGQVADRLEELVADRLSVALSLAAAAQEEAEKRLKEYSNQRQQTLDAVAPVLVDSHRYEAAPRARPDPRVAGVKAPSVRRGWVAERVGDEELVRLGVLMSREELDRLIDAYAAIQTTASGGAEGVEELLRVGTASAAGELDFLGSDRNTMELGEQLRRYSGLPPGSPDGLLRRTARDLAQADDVIRGAIADRLSRAISQLLSFRSEVAWDDPARAVQGLVLLPYTWVDF